MNSDFKCSCGEETINVTSTFKSTRSNFKTFTSYPIVQLYKVFKSLIIELVILVRYYIIVYENVGVNEHFEDRIDIRYVDTCMH